MKENRIKKALREGRIAVGTTLGELGGRSIPKLLEYANLDWVMVDMEHTGWTTDTVADLVSWFKATPITVVVRPPDNLYHFMAGLMDVGADGIMASHIETAEDARAIVDAVMYPPLGNRGVGTHSLHTDFATIKTAEYMPRRNAETTIIAMIESQKGLDNVEEIAAVDGIDVIQPSHEDLSVSLGVPQQYEHPKYKDALKQVIEACKRRGKAGKINPHNDADIDFVYNLGYRVLGIRHTVAAFKAALKSDADHLRSKVPALHPAAR